MRLLVLMLLASPAAWAGGEDWPQWRGPNRDGVSHCNNLLKSWPEGGPKEVWRHEIGSGFSSIAVIGSDLYTQMSENETEYLAAYDAKNGKEKWRIALGKMYVDEFGNGPRSGPTVDGDMVYALGSYGDLAAVNRKTGEQIWKVSFSETHGGKVGRWGYSLSPLVDGDMVLLEVAGGEGKALAALNKATGETLWSGLDGIMGYSSPIAVNYKGNQHYVFLVSKAPSSPGLPPKQYAVGISKKGQKLWEHETPGFIVATPVWVGPDRIFISASNDDGCRMLKLSGDANEISVEEQWANRNLRNHFNSSILHDGHLYGFNNATLTCLDVETGEVKWAKRGLGKGSLILTGDRFIALSDRGKMVMFKAHAKGYEQISTFQPLRGKSWTPPTIAGGKMYLRNLTHMVCIDLRG